jgi:hypothetical protein
MKIILKASIAFVLLSGLAATPVKADQFLCDCLVRCAKLYTEGTPQYDLCAYDCEQKFGIGLCKASAAPVKADRLTPVVVERPKAVEGEHRKL